LTPNKPSESGSAQANVVRPYGDHAALVRSESIAEKDMMVSGPGGGGFVTFANLNGAEVNVQVGLSFVSPMGRMSRRRTTSAPSPRLPRRRASRGTTGWPG
jgi:hypothetical protein